MILVEAYWSTPTNLHVLRCETCGAHHGRLAHTYEGRMSPVQCPACGTVEWVAGHRPEKEAAR